MSKIQLPLESLIHAENWEISNGKVKAFGQEFPLCHPWAIYAKLYRNETNPEIKFNHMKKMHDFMWPGYIKTWNYWTERRFRAHCEGYSFISFAGGASTGKSNDAAMLANAFWTSDPANNAVIVASTTLQSLSKRIWGYMVRFMHQSQIPLKFHYTKSPTPQFVYDQKDEIHCMSAMAAGVGTDEQAIRNYIGRHPNKKFLLILDEATDLNPVLLRAVPNLAAGEEGKLQVIVIGNSLSKSDLHGALSTPKNGWDSIDRMKDLQWETTQKNGICLYFPEWDSPAIHETDPEKKKLLGKFLITEEQVKEKKQQYGENSIDYMRFVAGFWQESVGGTGVFVSEAFLRDYPVDRKSLWSGLYPLHVVGGLDPAFSASGDSCILRLGIIGQNTSGHVVFDFREHTFLFKLKMYAAGHKNSIPVQLADQIIDILVAHKCRLEDLCLDCTGQGRTFGDAIQLRAAQRGFNWGPPIQLMSARTGNKKNNQDVIVMSPTEIWDNLKSFIQTGQIYGLDEMAIYQLTNRLIVFNPKTRKRELESKQDFRNRMSNINPGKGNSPDEADAASLAIFAAIHRYNFHLQQTKALETPIDHWTEKLRIQHAQDKKMAEPKKPSSFVPRATYSGTIGVGVRGPWNK